MTIKTPVRYDGRTRIRDANDVTLLKIESPSYLLKDEELWEYCRPIGEQIAQALNAATERRLAELEAKVASSSLGY